MAKSADRFAWIVTGLVLLGVSGYAAKRFMEPNQPSGDGIPVGPPPGSEFVGRQFEPFRLRGVDGKPVDCSKDLGRKPVVVVFHGGQESPFSTAQVAHLGSQKVIRDAGAVIYVISIDDPKDTARDVMAWWRREHRPERRDDFIFVGDDYGSYSEQYVGPPTRPNPNLPGSLNRGTLVVGKNRKIVFAYVNKTPKLQPPEDAMLAAVQKAKKEIDQAAGVK